MAITDELRKWAHGLNTYNRNELQVLAIADHIDTEHERRMEERADRYSELRAKMNNCCIELPKDADGEYIHVGDEMEWCDSGETLEVVGIGADDTLFYFDKDSDGEEMADWTSARNKRHHKQPTVEGVLREFALRVAGKECMTARPDVITEYAAKLRLAGSDAE